MGQNPPLRKEQIKKEQTNTNDSINCLVQSSPESSNFFKSNLKSFNQNTDNVGPIIAQYILRDGGRNIDKQFGQHMSSNTVGI